MLHLAWAEQEKEESRVEQARNIFTQISNTNQLVKATDILENILEAKVSAAEAVKLVTRLAMLLAVNGEAVKAETVVNDAINKYESSAESGLPLRAKFQCTAVYLV